jgi:hypothetical protein
MGVLLTNLKLLNDRDQIALPQSLMIIAARLGLPATGTLSAVAILSIVSRPGRCFGASMREMLARIIPAARASSPLLHLDFLLRSLRSLRLKLFSCGFEATARRVLCG